MGVQTASVKRPKCLTIKTVGELVRLPAGCVVYDVTIISRSVPDGTATTAMTRWIWPEDTGMATPTRFAAEALCRGLDRHSNQLSYVQRLRVAARSVWGMSTWGPVQRLAGEEPLPGL
jgi:hypothetical protein